MILFRFLYLPQITTLTAAESIWMVDEWLSCDFRPFFNSILVISGQLADYNERLCAMDPRLRLRGFHLEWGSNPGPLDK